MTCFSLITSDSSSKPVLVIHPFPLQYGRNGLEDDFRNNSPEPDNPNCATEFTDNEQLDLINSVLEYLEEVENCDLQPQTINHPSFMNYSEIAKLVSERTKTPPPPPSTGQESAISTAEENHENTSNSVSVAVEEKGEPVPLHRRSLSIEIKQSMMGNGGGQNYLTSSPWLKVERIEGKVVECPAFSVNRIMEAMDRSYVNFSVDQDVSIGNLGACILSTCAGENPHVSDWLQSGSNVVYLLPEKEKIWKHELNPSTSLVEILNDHSASMEFLNNPKISPLDVSQGHFTVQLSFDVKRRRKDQLELQSFTCPNCFKRIEKGIFANNTRYCDYTGLYFCRDCHSNKSAEIPARILQHWDFRKYRVCDKVKDFLDKTDNDPNYRLSDFDARLPRIARAISQVKLIRTQLGFLKEYFQSCRFSDNTWGNTLLGGRIHFAENLESYSLRDLKDLESNTLIAHLKAATQKLISHVLQCPVCRMKGFVCEICNDPKVIFPFQLDVVVQCNECKSFFHSTCFRHARIGAETISSGTIGRALSTSAGQCPKCVRLRKRLTDRVSSVFS